MPSFMTLRLQTKKISVDKQTNRQTNKQTNIPTTGFIYIDKKKKKKKGETGKRKQRYTRGRKTRVAVGPECPMERRQEGLKGRRGIIFRGIGGGATRCMKVF